MSNESKILPLLAAGSIKLKEEYSKIQVNCAPEDGKGSPTKSGLENLEIEVLFPTEKGQQFFAEIVGYLG